MNKKLVPKTDRCNQQRTRRGHVPRVKTGEFSFTFPALRCQSLIINGAGEGNRTPSQDCEAHLNRSQFALWTARRFHPATSAAFAGDMVFETIYSNGNFTQREAVMGPNGKKKSPIRAGFFMRKAIASPHNESDSGLNWQFVCPLPLSDDSKSGFAYPFFGGYLIIPLFIPPVGGFRRSHASAFFVSACNTTIHQVEKSAPMNGVQKVVSSNLTAPTIPSEVET